MRNSISIIGAPMWLGQTRYGTNLAPDALRTVGLLARLQAIHEDIIDLGNIPITTTGQFKASETKVKNLKSIAAACDKIAKSVADILANSRFPLVLGGDHSIAIGTLAGITRRYHNPGVIWYDAHADINTHETTPSGNIHGMPLAVSMGLGHETLVNACGSQCKIKPENIVFIGVRDIDAGEADLIDTHNIKLYTVDDVNRLGMDTVIAETVQYLSKCDGIHLSFDIDGIDPVSMPGVGTPVAGGISYEDSLRALQLLAELDAIISAEFVELNPLLDKDSRTTKAAMDLIAAFVGEKSLSEAARHSDMWQPELTATIKG